MKLALYSVLKFHKSSDALRFSVETHHGINFAIDEYTWGCTKPDFVSTTSTFEFFNQFGVIILIGVRIALEKRGFREDQKGCLRVP